MVGWVVPVATGKSFLLRVTAMAEEAQNVETEREREREKQGSKEMMGKGRRREEGALSISFVSRKYKTNKQTIWLNFNIFFYFLLLITYSII